MIKTMLIHNPRCSKSRSAKEILINELIVSPKEHGPNGDHAKYIFSMKTCFRLYPTFPTEFVKSNEMK
ncbi:MAG: hypothetical protein K2Q18_01185, partial [Bdellovibrionales bacterium]|nr:hypothetical protein [Bdellovibrionales bacterium]